MVFFIYVGGSPGALAASGIIFLVSMLLSNVNILDVFVNGDVGDDGYYTSYEDIELDRIYRQQRASLERRRNRERLASATQPGFWSTLFTSCAIVTLVFCMMLTAAVALFYWRPDLREHRLVRGIIRRLNRLEDRFINWLAERGLWFTNTARRPRPRVSFAEIQKLQKETFVSEDELSRWSVATLKEELRRLQRQADMNLGFAGGSQTRETQLLLRSGVGIEKAELVQAVLKARGGDSGVSCAVCLANYESGDELRVLKCGHRFHCDCVDRWLTQQSRTCPLCSKRV
mmetsp:Transcript_38812/g.80747  ORF Transcript_38812/g.80747 Transcript_38812/m.80747 type:complete len:287 (+) Transcript_38812:138-998(+)